MQAMLSEPIPESPLARLVLELAAQRASCKVVLGARTLFLRSGEIVGLQGAGSDLALGPFLVAAGRIEARELAEAEQRARARGLPLEQVLSEYETLGPDVLVECFRALLLDRLVRTLEEEERGALTPSTEPFASNPSGPTFATHELVLDALARRAAFVQAGVLGAAPATHFAWSEGELRARAEAWAQLGHIAEPTAVYALFPRHPSAPSRLVALTRAGLGQLSPGEQVRERASAPGAISLEPPARLDVDRQDPETDAKSLGPLGIEPVEPWLTRGERELGDPLEPLEQQVRLVAGTGAPTRERAEAWLALAEGWLREQRSFAEAARAAREAAAVAPEHVEALSLASALTAACGTPELAYAYALAWAEHATVPDEKAQALQAAADYARRSGRSGEQLESLRRALEAAPGDAALEERLARVLAEQGERQAAVEHARKASERLRGTRPHHARSLLAWAAALAPANLRTWTDLAKSYVRRGKGDVGVAVLARAARLQRDPAVRERLRLAGVAFAELAKRFDLASELLLEAVELRPALAEPLCANLAASGEGLELAVLASELAAHAIGTERAQLLLHAAEARRAGAGGTLELIDTLSDALVADPDLAPAYDALLQLTREQGREDLLLEALERALRPRIAERALVRDSEQLRSQVVHIIERLELHSSGPAGAPLLRFLLELRRDIGAGEPAAELVQQLAPSLAAYEEQLHELEASLRTAAPQERSAPAMELAAWCRRAPERRTTARKLYEKLLERDPRAGEARVALTSLLRLLGEEDARIALLSRLAEGSDRARDHVELAYALRRANRLREACAAAGHALACRDHDRELLTLAYRLGTLSDDLPLARTALVALIDDTTDARRRAVLGMRLARLEQQTGNAAGELAAGLSALGSDPACAEAALLIAERAEELANEGAVAILRSARAVLGDSPELLRQLGRACFTAADAIGQREAIEALLELSPEDGYAARALVAIRTTEKDPDALARAIEVALEPARFARPSGYVVQRGLMRLVQLDGEPTRALELVLRACEQLGEQARPLLSWCDSTFEALADRPIVAHALELRAALARGEDQVAELRRLALWWRERGVAWAERRAILRVLALAPDDVPSLERLLAIYAETGQQEQLEAALSLLVERADDDDKRRDYLLTRALVRLHFASDLEGALELAQRALTLDEPPLEALRRGVGMFVASAPQRAFALLMELAESSQGARARELREEALLLAEHQLATPELALEAAHHGALRDPTHLPFLHAVERNTRTREQKPVLLATLEAVAERMETAEQQSELLLRAAEVADELGDSGRACALLDRAYRATPTQAIEDQVLAAAGKLFADDMRAGRLAYDRLRDTLHVRAKFGPPLTRARALMTLARLALDIYLSRDDAARYAEAARAVLAESVDAAASEERDHVRSDLATLLLRLARGSESMRPVQKKQESGRKSRAPELDPAYAAALHDAPTLRPSVGPRGASLRPLLQAVASIAPTSPLSSLPSVEIRPREERTASHGETGPFRSDADLLSNSVLRGLSEGPPDYTKLARAVADEDGSALDALNALVQRDRSLAPVLCAELLAAVRERGPSVLAVRGLRTASAAARAHAIWRTSSQLLALVEPELRPPAQNRPNELRGPLADAALAAARETEHAEALQLLGQIVEAASPLFRRNLVSGGGEQAQLRPLKDPPYSQVLSELTRIFGTRHEAYLTPSEQNHVGLVSVLPASILVGNRTPPDAQSLRYRLARAFEHARPENVLLATLPAGRVQTLLAAILAAFAPPQRQLPNVPRDAAALASDLWRTMPGAAQRAVTRQLKESSLDPARAFDQRTLEQAVRLRSARTALFVTRELDVALAQLGLDGDPYDAQVGQSEQELLAALRDNELARGLFRYAFSESYLNFVEELSNG